MSHVGFGGFRLPARWAYACIGGGVALPCTALGYWQTGSEVSVSAVVVGGLVTGYLLARSNTETGSAGTLVGIVGGLPILRAVFDTYAAGSTVAEPLWFELAGGARSWSGSPSPDSEWPRSSARPASGSARG